MSSIRPLLRLNEPINEGVSISIRCDLPSAASREIDVASGALPAPGTGGEPAPGVLPALRRRRRRCTAAPGCCAPCFFCASIAAWRLRSCSTFGVA